jgi:hypothetical protein
MPTIFSRRTAGFIAAAAAACLLAAGCSSSGSGSGGAAASSAKQAGQSVLANPTYSAEITQLENELLASYQKNFSPLHPVKSMGVALHAVFPSASISETAKFAVGALTTDMAGKSAKAKAARQAWAQKVVKHVIGENPNATAKPGSAVIPGVPASPSPKPSVSSS